MSSIDAPTELRVLVVDDDIVDRMHVRHLLGGKEGMSVLEASDFDEAKHLLQSVPVDCLVLDYRLGEWTGLEVLDQLRPLAPPACPVIMVTGLGNEDVASAALRAGVSDYMSKNQLDHGRLARSVRGAVQQKVLERRVHDLAFHDGLTGLATRTLLLERLRQVIEGTHDASSFSALVYIDLDKFKPINDQFGHQAGDRVLVEIGRRLRDVVRGSDMAARMGGDEFALVLTELPSTEACHKAIERICEVVRRPIEIDVEQHLSTQVTASVGVVFIQDAETSADTLIRHADHTMYEVKRSGRAGTQFFDSQVEKKIALAQQQLDAVARGLTSGEFVLFYQPKIHLVTRKVLGFEALIRWNHPSRGLLAPAEFWQALHHKKLSVRIGEWVIAEALEELQRWAKLGVMTRVSVNVSADHLLSNQFTARLRELVAGAPGLQPNALEIEILETAAIEDLAKAAQTIKACKEMGVRVAIDDFGTGHSSLSYLRQLPVDVLKVDRSFVINMLENDDDFAIVAGVIGMCLAFKREVVAEGVESERHIEALVKLGCHSGQGYGIARPMMAQDVPAWFSRSQPN